MFYEITWLMTKLDATDKQILKCLQEDVSLAVTDVAKRVGLSTTPCWRRIQKLEENGIIQRRVALLNSDELNVGVTVFVAVKTTQHSAHWLETFAKTVSNLPEVMEFYRMSGEIDYLLRVVVPDVAAYDSFYKRLITQTGLSDGSSAFAMEQIKYTTALPLDYCDG